MVTRTFIDFSNVESGFRSLAARRRRVAGARRPRARRVGRAEGHAHGLPLRRRLLPVRRLVGRPVRADQDLQARAAAADAVRVDRPVQPVPVGAARGEPAAGPGQRATGQRRTAAAASRPDGLQPDDRRPVPALAPLPGAEALHQRIRRRLLADRVAQRARAEAVDDRAPARGRPAPRRRGSATAPRAPRPRGRRAGPATTPRSATSPAAARRSRTPRVRDAARRPTRRAPPLPASPAAHRRLEVVDRHRDAHPARLERRARAALLQRGDPALPAAAPAPRAVAEAPRPGLDRSRCRSLLLAARTPAAARASARRATARRRSTGAVTVSRSRRRRIPATSSRRPSTSRSASTRAARTASSRSLRARRRSSSATRIDSAALASASPRPLHGPGDLALLLADRRERGLERLLVLGEPAAGVGDDGRRQPQALGDRERLAAARQADREAVGRRQRLEVELDRRVARGGRLVRVDLDLRVVRGRGDQRARSG